MKKTHLQIALEHEVHCQMREHPQLVEGLTKKTQEMLIERTANELIKDDELWEQLNKHICNKITKVITNICDSITEIIAGNKED